MSSNQNIPQKHKKSPSFGTHYQQPLTKTYGHPLTLAHKTSYLTLFLPVCTIPLSFQSSLSPLIAPTNTIYHLTPYSTFQQPTSQPLIIEYLVDKRLHRPQDCNNTTPVTCYKHFMGITQFQSCVHAPTVVHKEAEQTHYIPTTNATYHKPNFTLFLCHSSPSPPLPQCLTSTKPHTKLPNTKQQLLQPTTYTNIMPYSCLAHMSKEQQPHTPTPFVKDIQQGS